MSPCLCVPCRRVPMSPHPSIPRHYTPCPCTLASMHPKSLCPTSPHPFVPTSPCPSIPTSTCAHLLISPCPPSAYPHATPPRPLRKGEGRGSAGRGWPGGSRAHSQPSQAAVRESRRLEKQAASQLLPVSARSSLASRPGPRKEEGERKKKKKKPTLSPKGVPLSPPSVPVVAQRVVRTPPQTPLKSSCPHGRCRGGELRPPRCAPGSSARAAPLRCGLLGPSGGA